jgi:predicted DCC family thiol-disulfide oxidoreductase YuxK
MPSEAANLIVFDSQCVFCSGFARFIARRDTAQVFRFVTAQSRMGRGLYQSHRLDPDLMQTNIVILGGASYVKMQAFAAAMSVLPAPWRWARIAGSIPKLLADWIYDRIARNRYFFGRRTCIAPSPALRARLIE